MINDLFLFKYTKINWYEELKDEQRYNKLDQVNYTNSHSIQWIKILILKRTAVIIV